MRNSMVFMAYSSCMIRLYFSDFLKRSLMVKMESARAI